MSDYKNCFRIFTSVYPRLSFGTLSINHMALQKDVSSLRRGKKGFFKKEGKTCGRKPKLIAIYVLIESLNMR